MISMSERYKYRAFGLVIASEFPIVQIPYAEDREEADVMICRKNLDAYKIPENDILIESDAVMFGIPHIGSFRVTEGKLIEADCLEKGSETHLAVYLMGSCMGAILHQRGLMPLHGSCVTNGKRAILITGESGAGKSTLASEFLSHGWRLLTDDVAAVRDIETIPLVQSSYPSQKLWQDSLEHYAREAERVHSLYFNENREKFGVSVADMFCEGTVPLSLIVLLIPADTESCIQPIEGFAKVNQLMCATYRFYMIAKEKQQQHFQRCAALSLKVPMALVLRKKGVQSAECLYEMIVNFGEEEING